MKEEVRIKRINDSLQKIKKEINKLEDVKQEIKIRFQFEDQSVIVNIPPPPVKQISAEIIK